MGGQEFLLPNGVKARVRIHFGNGQPRVRGHLFLMVRVDVFGWLPEALQFTVDEEQVELRDSEGFRFTLYRGFWHTYGGDVEYMLFEVDEDEALGQIRYNDPSYSLSLRFPFTLQGHNHAVEIPQIEPMATAVQQSGMGAAARLGVMVVVGVVATLVFLVGAIWLAKLTARAVTGMMSADADSSHGSG